MSPLARVIDERVDTVAVAAIEGEIDSSNVADIGRRLRETLTNQSMALVVDLEQTSYLDSAGINLLFALGAELRNRQQRLHLGVPAGSPIARMLAIASVQSAMPVHDRATQRSRPRRGLLTESRLSAHPWRRSAAAPEQPATGTTAAHGGTAP